MKEGTVEHILYSCMRNGKETRWGMVELILYVVKGNIKKRDSEWLNCNTVHHVFHVAKRNGKSQDDRERLNTFCILYVKMEKR